MKQYIILHESDINISRKKLIAAFKNTTLMPILKSDDITETGFYIYSFYDNNCPAELSNFKRFRIDTISTIISSIKAGLTIGRYDPEVSKVSAFPDSEGSRAKFKGSFKLTVPANDSASQVVILTEDRYITGAVYKGYNTSLGCRIDFEILAPNDYVVEKFAEGWYISDDTVKIETYRAKIPKDFKIKITYYNDNTIQESSVFINLLLHKV